jgi:uncharacterized protein with PQ loop repeat
MAFAEIAAILFTATNALRAIAYMPQIRCVLRDKRRASGVSIATWVLFAASNGSTVAYAILTLQDAIMAVIFSFNTVACLAIVAATSWKRMHGGTPD